MLELLPFHFFEEGMLFDLFDANSAEPVHGTTLDEPVDEIHAFLAPSIGRDLVQLHLFCQNFLSDFFAVCANIGSLHIVKNTLPVMNS